MRLKELHTGIKQSLKMAGIDTYSIDSDLIVTAAANISRVQLITREDVELTDEVIAKAEKLHQRRLRHEPMQYILGKCEFMGMDFKLTHDTLIPRGDTECLVELVLELIKANNKKTVLDIGTGSGAIIISLATLSNISGTAIDISQATLDVARQNADINGVNDRIEFIKSDLFENVSGSFDIIVSNPPYIESDTVATLDSQVKDFEPLTALDGGEDGLDFYRRIIMSAHRYLNKGGFLAFEIGYNQGAAVTELLRAADFDGVTLGQDLAGFDRTVFGRLTE